MAFRKLAKAVKDYVLGNGEVTPFKCKICRKWVKFGSKAKNVCRKCYEGLE